MTAPRPGARLLSPPGFGDREWVALSREWPWIDANASALHVPREDFPRLALALLGPERAAEATRAHGDERP